MIQSNDVSHLQLRFPLHLHNRLSFSIKSSRTSDKVPLPTDYNAINMFPCTKAQGCFCIRFSGSSVQRLLEPASNSRGVCQYRSSRSSVGPLDLLIQTCVWYTIVTNFHLHGLLVVIYIPCDLTLTIVRLNQSILSRLFLFASHLRTARVCVQMFIFANRAT